MTAPAAQHLIFITHTPRHLAAALASVGAQELLPTTVTLSCDVLSSEIREAAAEGVSAWPTAAPELLVLQREHTGQARAAQVRNNAVRALVALGRAHAQATDRLIFVDGDTALSSTAVSQHARLGGERSLVSTYRLNLTPEQTESFSLEHLRSGHDPAEMRPEQEADLRQRQRRYERQALWQRLGLGKRHKPRLIGGHFSVPLAAYVRVNGTDEAYEGFGQEDDDLTRRLRADGWPTVVAVSAIRVYHLYHPTRAPDDWHAASGAERFARGGPTRAECGLDRPAPQGPVHAWTIAGGSGRVRELEALDFGAPSSSAVGVHS